VEAEVRPPAVILWGLRCAPSHPVTRLDGLRKLCGLFTSISDEVSIFEQGGHSAAVGGRFAQATMFRDSIIAGGFLLTMLAASASADWFTQIMTIEGGRDEVFAAQWRAEKTCRDCRRQRCQRHGKYKQAFAEPAAPEPLIAPKSRFFPLPTRPAFEPQVPWFTREVFAPVPSHEPREPLPHSRPQRLDPPPVQVPLKPSSDGWRPARDRP